MQPAIYRDDSQVQPARTPAAVCALLCAFACLLLGCSTGRANSRVEYWVEQARDYLPVGTRLVDAERFFAARGLKLRCCTSGPDIDNAYFAMERNAGRKGIPEGFECRVGRGEWAIDGDEIRATYERYVRTADANGQLLPLKRKMEVVRLVPRDGKLKVLSGTLPEFGF
jgi:hypothetical protein